MQTKTEKLETLSLEQLDAVKGGIDLRKYFGPRRNPAPRNAQGNHSR